MALKRKSLAPLNTSTKKALKVTSISANNTPAKLQKPVGPNKKSIHAKQANLNKQTPSKGLNKKQKAFKPADSEDDDDEEEDDALGMEEDSDVEDGDSDIEQEEGSLDGEDEEDSVDGEDEEELVDGKGDNDMDEVSADDEENDTKHVPLVKIANKNVKDTKQKQIKDTKQTSTKEKVSSGDSCVLFVGQLNFETTEDEVRAYFLKAGPVVGVNLARFRHKPTSSRGFAFVQMKDEVGFKKALKLNNTTLGGRQIHVEISKRSSINMANDKPKPKSKLKKKAT